MKILFLDDNPVRHQQYDQRYPNDEVTHVATVQDFDDALRLLGPFDVVSLDYDLNEYSTVTLRYDGEIATGLDACGYMVKHMAKIGQVVIHSRNDAGSKEMMDFLTSKGIVAIRKTFEYSPIISPDWNAMTCEKFDPNCPGCRPAIYDPSTKQVMAQDHPMMVAVNAVWDAAPREEQEACWRIWVKNGRDQSDLRLASAFMEKVQERLTSN